VFQQEQDEPRTAEDKVLSVLNQLRGRMTDIMSQQADVKEEVRGVRGLVREARYDSKQHSEVSVFLFWKVSASGISNFLLIMGILLATICPR